jgi:hypothetical protein
MFAPAKRGIVLLRSLREGLAKKDSKKKHYFFVVRIKKVCMFAAAKNGLVFL